MTAVGALLFASVRAEGITPRQEQEWRREIRQALRIPDELPALNPQGHGSFTPTAGVKAERITYTTLLGLRIPAILYLPDPLPAQKIPALIVVNGHGGDKYSWYAFYSGMLYAKAGAAVLTYDPIGEGERNIRRLSGTRAHDVLQDPPELGRRMGAQLMTDLMQAVSYVSQRPEIDPKRIGAMGYSLGSFLVSITGAFETRLRTCVMVGGGNLDGPGGVWERGKPMCQGIPYQSLGFLGDRPAILYALHTARGPTFVYNGLQDVTVSIPTHNRAFFADLHARTVALRGNAAGVFEYDFTDGAHRPYFVTRPVAQWLERELDFPLWTKASIAGMPTTHISEWAKAGGVELDRLYASEEREGGTPALGTGLPALSRTDLSVLSPEEWEREKENFIYESWLKRARAELAANRP
jgi:dienelactone hydrolase